MEDKNKSDTFCIMPFHHINIKNEGKLSACWRYPDKVGDFLTDTLKDTWNGEQLRKVRTELVNGVQHKGCISCWDLERSGAKSLRQNAAEMYPDVDSNNIINNIEEDGSYPIKNLQSIEIRFDNICNLMCRHCSPTYSSIWEQKAKRDPILMGQMKKVGTYRELEKHVSLTQEIIDEVVSLSPNLTELMITGGEPLFHDKHYDFLERILPEANHITLQYNSNFSTLDYKGKSILDLWKHFKRVSIRVSLDAYPEIYEYVRVRGNLSIAEDNIKKALQLSNIQLSATMTANLLNITRATEIAKYYYSMGVDYHTSIVQFPRPLNPKLLPPALKEKVTNDWDELINGDREWMKSYNHSQKFMDRSFERWKKFGDNVINYMNGEDWYHYWDDFIEYANAQDQHHETNILDVYPEFRKYWHEV
jgi:radical SAM protein with 4Fe4S-binding SPASM domain